MTSIWSFMTAKPLSSIRRDRTYFRLEDVEAESKSQVDEQEEQETKRRLLVICINVVMLSIVALACGFIGYYIRSHSDSCSANAEHDFMTPPGNVRYPMVYNLTYTREPTDDTNAAWDAMFPTGVGFVKHPEISPKLSGIAVFHELHCVNMLRVGYYAALSGDIAEMQHIHDHNKRPDPHHLRHCFDYLRQSLICNADTNLEPVDFELGGVTGWKFERTCRNFDRVKEWAEEWHSWDPAIQQPGR